MKSPASRVKEAFSDKAKLVAEVKKLATGELFLARAKEGLAFERLSNGKLLRLHTVLSKAKADFGSRAKLVESILQLEKRLKDTGYKARLERFPTPRLLDLYQSLTRRAKATSAS